MINIQLSYIQKVHVYTVRKLNIDGILWLSNSLGQNDPIFVKYGDKQAFLETCLRTNSTSICTFYFEKIGRFWIRISQVDFFFLAYRESICIQTHSKQLILTISKSARKWRKSSLSHSLRTARFDRFFKAWKEEKRDWWFIGERVANHNARGKLLSSSSSASFL